MKIKDETEQTVEAVLLKPDHVYPDGEVFTKEALQEAADEFNARGPQPVTVDVETDKPAVGYQNREVQKWWLSYMEGETFLGVIIVEAGNVRQAEKRAEELGIVPGGAAFGANVSHIDVPDTHLDRLLTKEQAAEVTPIVALAVETEGKLKGQFFTDREVGRAAEPKREAVRPQLYFSIGGEVPDIVDLRGEPFELTDEVVTEAVEVQRKKLMGDDDG